MSTKRTSNIKLLAQYFISKGIEDKQPITNKKLQKLLYYSQAWSLVLRDNKKLFTEKIEAWVHGPAIRIVYQEYKSFGFSPIIMEIDKGNFKSISSDIKNLLNKVWNVYGSKDADYLEMLSHNERPWIEARKGLEVYESSDNTISTKVMKEYYSELLKKSKNKK